MARTQCTRVMVESLPSWSNSPEYRIIRELRETRIAGLAPGTSTSTFGRVVETLVIRELQVLAAQRSDADMRFARGYVVEDYGHAESGEVSLSEGDQVEKQGPRFDIVCYRGNVAWAAHERTPMALVPKSFVHGVIEVKRTVTPKRFGSDSNEHYNDQLETQRKYLEGLGADHHHIVIGANHFGTPKENRRKALADYVAVLGNLNEKPSATDMANDGELSSVVDRLLGIKPQASEKTERLQDIARNLSEDENPDT